jgi:hypothetical protein
MPAYFTSCLYCECAFCPSPSHVRDGWGLYCSRRCFYAHVKAQFPERFWALVEKTESCWLWRGRVSFNGYGVLDRHSPEHRRARPVAAHRIGWELTHGPLPDTQVVRHNCPGSPNPLCVNPAHLLLGTMQDNVDDMLRAGRHHTKLTEADVRAIRARHATGETTPHAMAAEYGVSASQIRNIVCRVAWKHLL